MKKVKYLIVLFICSFVMMPNVFASSGTINVKANNRTLVVGNTTKVTVTVSSSDLGAWEYCISYDSSVLKLTDSSADSFACVKTGYVSSKGQTSSSETFTFKALKSGSSNVTVKGYSIYAYSNELPINTTISSVKITTMTQKELEDTYSTNANLKSIAVGDYPLSPEFDKNTLEYKVEVPNDVESVTISTTKEDSTAVVSGSGTKELTEGNNKFEIIVTAQKGNSKTYVVNVYRKELDPIKVIIDGKEYFLMRKKDDFSQFPTFEDTTITIDNEEIPALHSNITDYTIVALKDENSKINMYIYENGNYTKYNEIKSNVLTIYPQELPQNDEFKGYEIIDIDYDNQKIQGYALSKTSNFAIIYAQNIETGDVKYYSFDKKNNTIQEYNEELINEFNEKIQMYKYVIFGFIGITLLLFIIIIFRKPKKKIIIKDNIDNNKKIEENLKSNEPEIIQEIKIIEEQQVIKQEENTPKKRGRKKKVEEVEPIKVEVEEIPTKVEVVKEKENSEIKVTKDDKTVELNDFKKRVDDAIDEEREITEAYKKMNLIDNEDLSKREVKKLQKKLRKEEKARLKEF